MSNRTMAAWILLLIPFAWARADAPPAAAAGSREAFLKLIDRPRVEAKAEESPMVGPAGMTQTHVAISTEAGQRMPAILLRRAAADDGKPPPRLPVVIILHGTGGRKEGNLGLAKTLA